MSRSDLRTALRRGYHAAGMEWKKAARAAEPVAVLAVTLALLTWCPQDAVRVVLEFVFLALLVSIAWDIVRGMLPNGE